MVSSTCMQGGIYMKFFGMFLCPRINVMGWKQCRIEVLVGCKGMGKRFSCFLASRHTQVVKRKCEFVYDCTYSFLFKHVSSTVLDIYG